MDETVYVWQWQAFDGRWHDLSPEWESEESARDYEQNARHRLHVDEPLRLTRKTVTYEVLEMDRG